MELLEEIANEINFLSSFSRSSMFLHELKMFGVPVMYRSEWLKDATEDVPARTHPLTSFR